MKIVFATNNQHKLSEIRSILGDSIEVLQHDESGEGVFSVELPHQVDFVFRHGLQVWVAPYLSVGRGVVDAAHGAPIAGIDGLAAEGTEEGSNDVAADELAIASIRRDEVPLLIGVQVQLYSALERSFFNLSRRRARASRICRPRSSDRM